MKTIFIKTQEHSKNIVSDKSVPLLPHERDEAPDRQSIAPKKIMKQAYADLQRGLVDTDLHGQRGVEDVLKPIKKSSVKK